ncbi:MAG: polysaccharide deacetylase family protein, partial [Clostridia bacterium]|nr:polysaccharide deacetylase family protein [Clostridia bacterium]
MHFCVINSKTLMFAGCMVLVMILLGISIGGSTSAQVFFGYSTRQVPVYQVETDEKKVAISFDAAWGADKTQGILDILKEYNCTATFFLVAFWAEKYPEMVKAIDDAGMEIGNHSATHPDLTTVSAQKLADELAITNQQITSITKKPVRVFRCPYGAYNNDVLNAATAAG